MVVVQSQTDRQSAGSYGYDSVFEIVDARIAAFKAWLVGEQRKFNVAVGDRIDVIADVMGSGACGDVKEVTEMPDALESVSMPKHHYQAILRLYRTDPAAYRALLDQSKEFIDHLDHKDPSESLAESVSGTRGVLARIIALYEKKQAAVV